MSLATQPERAVSAGEPDNQGRCQQVRRILASRSFRNAPLLQKFLQFITSESNAGHVEELTEYAIATRVFGRPQAFDPASDTIVRTQAYRLRTKLKEYYETEGKSDPLVVEIPKGHYVPSFSVHPPDRPSLDLFGSTPATGTAVPSSSPAVHKDMRGPAAVLVTLGGILLGVILFLAGAFLGARWFSSASAGRTAANVPEPLGKFWGSFLSGDDLILAYTNSVFLETETGDLLRFRGGAVADRGALVGKAAAQADAVNLGLAERAGPLYYEDGYTGTGEVLAVHRLTSLLGALGAKVQVKRSRLITADDFRNHNVIFLGSPFENQVLAEMHLAQRFTFQEPSTPPYLWQGRIVDNSVFGGRIYRTERDPRTKVIRADYALLDVFPGPVPGRRIVVLAGLTTSGTQGAAEFATSPEGLQQILNLLGVSKGDQKVFPTYLECLLRVEAARGLDALDAKFVVGGAIQAQDRPNLRNGRQEFQNSQEP